MLVRASALFSITALLAMGAMAEETQVKLSPLKAQGAWEAGQIEEASDVVGGQRVDKEMLNRATVWFLQEAALSDNAKVYLGVGGGYFFVYPRELGFNPYTHSKRSGFGLTDAHGEFTFMDKGDGNHGLLLKAGIFGFKYNEDAKNLGEYMFRTWTYPNVITTNGLEIMNTAGAQLSGFDFNTRLNGINNDVIVSIQSDHAPIYGISLTDIASYNIGGFLTLGAGYMLDNIYDPDPENLKPKKTEKNSYYTLSDGRKMAIKEYTDLVAANAIDPALIKPVDTSYYSFQGQKAMLRATFDLGKILNNPMLSDKDLRFYAEAILMGVQDRPTYYTKKSDRMAYLLGFNWPTFKFLDILSTEVEICKNPFPNSTQGPYGDGTAIPHLDDTKDQFPNVRVSNKDDFKWTIFASKKVMDGVAIQFQAASDHLRMSDIYSTPTFDDFLQNWRQWYWLFRIQYSI